MNYELLQINKSLIHYLLQDLWNFIRFVSLDDLIYERERGKITTPLLVSQISVDGFECSTIY